MARCDVQICIWSKRCQHELDQRKLSSGITDDGRMVEQPQHVSYKKIATHPSKQSPVRQLWKESLHILLVKVDRGVFQRCGATTWDWFIRAPRIKAVECLKIGLMVICTLENFYARWKKCGSCIACRLFSMDQGSKCRKKTYHCDNHLNRNNDIQTFPLKVPNCQKP